MKKYESDKRPIDSVERFCEIYLENEGTFVSRFDRMEGFLGNHNWFRNLSIFKKPKLLRGDGAVQEGL